MLREAYIEAFTLFRLAQLISDEHLPYRSHHRP